MRLQLDTLSQIREAIQKLNLRFDDRKLYRNTCQWDYTSESFLVPQYFGSPVAIRDIVTRRTVVGLAADFTVNCGANQTLWLVQSVYDDLYFPMTVGKLPGANFPTWAAFQGNTEEYTFGINDYIQLPSQEIGHKYDENTAIEGHVHIVTNGVDIADRDVNYEIEYTWGNPGGQMTAAAIDTTGDYTIPANTPDRTHLYLTFGNIIAGGAGVLIGAALKIRFRRIALTGGGTAPTSDPFVLMVGVHIEMDTIGSRNQLTK